MDHSSKIAITYFILILCIGAFLLIQEIVNNKKWKHQVIRSKMSWTDFGLLIWSLITSTLIIQTTFWFLLPSKFPEPWPHVTLGFLIQISMFIFIVFSAWLYPRLFDFPISSKLTSTLHATQQGILAFLTAMPIVWLVNLIWINIISIWKYFGFQLHLKEQELIKLFSESNSPLLLSLIIVFGVLIAPITEEIIFRGGIYRFLKSKMHSSFALGISAFLFAWVHANLLSFLPLFLLGLLLARSYEKTGNIITPIIFHSLFNANSLIILLIDPKFYSINS